MVSMKGTRAQRERREGTIMVGEELARSWDTALERHGRKAHK